MSENEHDIPLKDLYELLKKEAENPTLQQIEPDTYQKVAIALGSLKGQGFEGVEAKVRDRMVELLSTSARLLFEVRRRKFLSPAEPLDYSRLTDEEKYVPGGATMVASIASISPNMAHAAAWPAATPALTESPRVGLFTLVDCMHGIRFSNISGTRCGVYKPKFLERGM